jgi:predicted nucleic acid-binding protein
MARLRVVLDTNVLVSGLVYPNSGLTRKSGGTSDSIIATGGLYDEQAET